jgi:hypothetical protein
MTDPRLTDAQLAAEWSAQALREGRYELGFVLARIAAQAHRATQATVAVPMAGQTRDEQPRRPQANQTDLDTFRDAVERVHNAHPGGLAQGPRPQIRIVPSGSTGDTSTDQARREVADAATSILRAIDDRPSVAAGTRCAAIDLGSAMQLPCDQPIYLEHTPSESLWLHIDTSLNAHHDAVLYPAR